MSFFPLHVHTHYSLQRALPRGDQLARRLRALGYPGCAVTDYGSVSGVPSFLNEMADASLKGVPGCEFLVCENPAGDKSPDNNRLRHVCVLAKTQRGWDALVQAVSHSNLKGFHDGRPRISLGELSGFCSDWVVSSGHPGSHFADACFASREAYAAKTYEEARALVRADWREAVLGEMRRFLSLFGDVYCEVCLANQRGMPAALVAARILRHLAPTVGLPLVATTDTHYLAREDAPDFRVVLAGSLETPLADFVRRATSKPAGDVGAVPYFQSNDHHLPGLDELLERHTPDEVKNSLLIAERCQPVSLKRQPMLPKVGLPAGVSADERLRDLCRAGWKRKRLGNHPDYLARIEEELAVITGFGLSPYFLVVEDYVRYAVEVLGAYVGRGRGSAAGCLVSYLTGITKVDPVRFDLMFARFINAGRMSKDRIKLPDVDSDFPTWARDKILSYCENKYGKENVCQMATFSRTQGRGALKDVLRAHRRVSAEEMNLITKSIPDESAIADDLQGMFEGGETPSIILWALEHNPEPLKPWCRLVDGELVGPLANDFAQAVRLEGTNRNMGRHPSGLIIAPVPVAALAPMVTDRRGSPIVGYDMHAAEAVGLVKFDVLATNVLNALQDCDAMVRGR